MMKTNTEVTIDEVGRDVIARVTVDGQEIAYCSVDTSKADPRELVLMRLVVILAQQVAA